MICETCAPESEKVTTERIAHHLEHVILILVSQRLQEKLLHVFG